jgi:hypothetical protein
MLIIQSRFASVLTVHGLLEEVIVIEEISSFGVKLVPQEDQFGNHAHTATTTCITVHTSSVTGTGNVDNAVVDG